MGVVLFRWTNKSIGAYIEYYNDLKAYKVRPFQTLDETFREPAIRGERRLDSPGETQSILNADFDSAIEHLPLDEQRVLERFLGTIDYEVEIRDNWEAKQAVKHLKRILLDWQEIEDKM